MKKETLPQGNNIRLLLVNSSISDAGINSVLKNKGVFIGRTEKNNSVPLLMKTLISPDDFENLYSIQKVKEESVKHRTATIDCRNDFQLSDILSDPIDLNKSIIDSHTYRPDYKVVGSPNFYFEDEKSAVFEYKIERENVLNDWTSNKTYHTASLRIDKDNSGSVHISVQQNSTSKETQIINSIIVSHVKEKLQSHSLVKSEDTFMSIRFNDFDNTSRIKFLYSFSKDLNDFITFKSLTDLNLFLDTSVVSHADLEKFLNEIENLKLKGKSLHNHVFIKSDKYHDKLLCAAISLKFKISFKGIEGHIYLYLSFPDYIKSRSIYSDFQTEIKFSLGNIKKRSSTENKLRKDLLLIVDKMKIDKFDKFRTNN